ncbi:MAG: hypothetical protein V8Q36_04970 [Anaerotignum sp.]
MMERKQITAFLSEQLIQDRLPVTGNTGQGKSAWTAGTKDVRRVDFMEFCPTGVLSVSEIEKGIFVSYEVKSCMADYKSGFGQNFVTGKNYIGHAYRSLQKNLAKASKWYWGDLPYPVGKRSYG